MQQTFGQRLTWLRKQKEWTISRLADELTYDKSYISRVESGQSRNPSTRFVDAICGRFGVNHEWLLTGKGETFVEEATGGAALREPARDDPFGESLAEYLQILPVLRVVLKEVSEQDWQSKMQSLLALPGVKDQIKRFWAMNLIRAYYARDQDGNSLQATISTTEAQAAILNTLMRDLAAGPESGNKSKKSVDTISEFRKTTDMKSELKGILASVRRLTKARGAKGKLAKAIGVPQSRLSEWLAETYEPSGESALRLRQWVERQER